MNKFPRPAYTWIMRGRAMSASGLAFLLFALLVDEYVPDPSRAYLAIGVTVGAAIWLLTAPSLTLLFFSGLRLEPRLLWARRRPLCTLPALTDIASRMNAPLPNAVKVVSTDKVNARTNGRMLFITRGLVPYLGTSVGEAILAHELAHAKLWHSYKLALVISAVGVLSSLFGAQFWPSHNAVGFVMGAMAFITLLAAAFPLVSRKMEYDADALASEVVGPDAMIVALKFIVSAEDWPLESDSHPSIKARIQRTADQPRIQSEPTLTAHIGPVAA